MARLLSVNVGLPRDIEWKGRTVRTGIWKNPVRGRCPVNRQGVTAQFNLNLLHRINRELQATIPVEAFRHLARWNDFESPIGRPRAG